MTQADKWHRTNLFILRDEYEALRRLAFEERKTISELLREAIQEYLGQRGRKPALKQGKANVPRSSKKAKG